MSAYFVEVKNEESGEAVLTGEKPKKKTIPKSKQVSKIKILDK